MLLPGSDGEADVASGPWTALVVPADEDVPDGEVDVASGPWTALVVPVDEGVPDAVGRSVDVLPEGPGTLDVVLREP